MAMKMKSKTLWGFGDSWAYGWGLSPKESNYTYLLSEKLNVNYQNAAESGRGLGEILELFIKKSSEFSPDDFVLITVPPDTRWYTPAENGNESLHTLFSWQSKYKSFLKLINCNLYWFYWHHSLFLSSIYNHARRKKVKLVMQHNYGKLSIIPEFEYVKEAFADSEHSMSFWLSVDDEYDYSLTKGCGPEHAVFQNKKYFIENDSHPNQLGHAIIADKLYDAFTRLT